MFEWPCAALCAAPPSAEPDRTGGTVLLLLLFRLSALGASDLGAAAIEVRNRDKPLSMSLSYIAARSERYYNSKILATRDLGDEKTKLTWTCAISPVRC